jgi:hypothetical protein
MHYIISIKWVRSTIFLFYIILFLFIDIVHRDLKLENILLKNVPQTKTDEFDIRVCFLFILHNK